RRVRRAEPVRGVAVAEERRGSWRVPQRPVHAGGTRSAGGPLAGGAVPARRRVVPGDPRAHRGQHHHDRAGRALSQPGQRRLSRGRGPRGAAAGAGGKEEGMKPRDRLRIAMQKSGRLTEPALGVLARCGLTFRQSRDKLFCFGEVEPVDLLLVRDDDIPGLIAQGVCDVGIVGRNVLSEFQLGQDGGMAPLAELRPLGFGACRLSIAVPDELAYGQPGQLLGLRIATSYPGLLREWLRAREVKAEVVTLSGSVEIAPRL